MISFRRPSLRARALGGLLRALAPLRDFFRLPSDEEAELAMRESQRDFARILRGLADRPKQPNETRARGRQRV